MGAGGSTAAQRRALRATLIRPVRYGWSLAPKELEEPVLAAPFSGGTPVLWRRTQITVEPGERGVLTLLSAEPQDCDGKMPVVILMHMTGAGKEVMAIHAERLAQRGFLAVAFDARNHGERALPNAGLEQGALHLPQLGQGLLDRLWGATEARVKVYHDALVRAWCEPDSGERPFLYDTVSDAMRVVDHLVSLKEVDAARIGATGVSLGGMHCWLLAAADERVAATASSIGVQSFRYALDNDEWRERVNTILPVFERARADAGVERLTSSVVESVWRRLVPGLCEVGDGSFDSLASLGFIAPRPHLILSGEVDPRCPLAGVREAVALAAEEYKLRGATVAEGPGPSRAALRHFVQAGVGHEQTPAMWKEIDEFFITFLEPHDDLTSCTAPSCF